MVCPRRLADRQVTLRGSRAASIVSVAGLFGAAPPFGGQGRTWAEFLAF